MTKNELNTFIDNILKYKYISVFLDFKFLDFVFNKQNINFKNFDLLLNLHKFLMRNDVIVFNPYNNKKIDYKDLLMLYSSEKYRQKTLIEFDNKEYSESFGNNFFTFIFTEKEIETNYINVTSKTFLEKFKQLTTSHLVYFNSTNKKYKNWGELIGEYIIKKDKTSFLIIAERFLNSLGSKTEIDNKDDNIAQIINYFNIKNYLVICQKQPKEKDNINSKIELEKVFVSSKTQENTDILHDRYIFTNYFIINSAHSMDFFDKTNFEKETQLCFSSILNSDAFNILLSKLNSYKQLN